MKVAILDDYQNIAQYFADWENSNCDIKVFNEPFESEDQTIENIKEFEALLLMRERTPMTRKVIESCPNLKIICTGGMRNKSIDLQAAKENNIKVCGTEMNVNSTAELTWALIMGLARNLRQETENMFQGYWQTTVGTELKGKVLGLAGLGKQGTQVANIGKAFGMEVIAWSENLKMADAEKKGVLAVSKDDLLERSDILSIHLVLSDRTKNLFKYEDMSKMKSTSFIINTSRGPIINENDLIKILEEEKIAGAGLDVYDIEPLPENHKLRFMQNAFLLPHLGYVTKENYYLMYSQMAENLKEFMSGSILRELE
jgi:phosphoglycerate dehydrogenase-like enzyme